MVVVMVSSFNLVIPKASRGLAKWRITNVKIDSQKKLHKRNKIRIFARKLKSKHYQKSKKETNL
jgi:hypothetical protein